MILVLMYIWEAVLAARKGNRYNIIGKNNSIV